MDLESRDYDLTRKLSELVWAIEDNYDPADVSVTFSELSELVDELYMFWRSKVGYGKTAS